ncbi:hypothetical protein BBJ28_00006796 [Nothophytophthora sp. Chile5]|nr:hypothetical protein BBJ28_00006796 [Nothophytophthora sp. Chile5]
MCNGSPMDASSPADCRFADLLGFRPVVLYDTRVDMVDESLTLSRSARSRQLPQFSTLSSAELDEIDAECSVGVPSRDQQQVKTPVGPPPETRQQQDRLPRPPRSRDCRYAAREDFFNYRALGSLRLGLAPIALLSRRHAGLAVTAFASGATLAFLRSTYRPLLVKTMTGHFPDQYDAAAYSLEWPGALSMLLGLLSDCVPLCGTRRKSYIALAWTLSALSFGTACAFDLQREEDAESLESTTARSLLVACSVVGCLALQLAWVSALALVVGFGQRETLGERGGLATLFLAIWQAGALATHIAVTQVQRETVVTLPGASAALAAASVLALPFVLCFLRDDDEREAATTLAASTKRVGVMPALRMGVVQLWEICQEEATYRLLFFLLVYGVLLQASDPGVHDALTDWSGFTSSSDDREADEGYVLVVQSGVAVLALLHAKWKLLGVAWRPFAFVGAGLVAIGTLTQALPIALDLVRAEWFFSLLAGLLVWPKTWLLLFTLLPSTEVAHVGCEGVTMGLVLSFQTLSSLARHSVSAWISQATGTRVTADQLEDDDVSTRYRVIAAAAAYSAVNLLAMAAVPLLPRSKLDTQQLRAFGRYSRRAAGVLVLLLVLLAAIVVVANLQKV